VTGPRRQRDEGLFTKSGGQPPRVGPAATFDIPESILIIFGSSATEKVGNQEMFYFPTSSN